MWTTGLVVRVGDRSWVTPAALFALIWAFYTPTLLFFVPSAEPFIHGAVWITAAVGVVALGAVIASVLLPRIRQQQARIPGVRAIPVLRKLVWLSVLAGLTETVILFLQRGATTFSLLNLMAVSAANRADNYAGEAETGIVERFAIILLYLGALYGGTLFRLSGEKRDKILGLAGLLVLVLINTLHGSRFGSIYGGGFWLSAYLATHVALSDPVEGVKSKFLFRFAITGIGVVLGFSLVTMGIRYQMWSGGEPTVGWWYIFSDPFGFVAAFCLWFNDYHAAAPELGARMFRRIAGLWGVDYPLYLPVDVGFNSSNVFTVFRELIDDFTPFGALEFLLFYGFAARIAFWAAMRNNRMAVPFLAICYGFALTSVASSAFAYTTIVAAMLIFIFGAPFLPALTVSSEHL